MSAQPRFSQRNVFYLRTSPYAVLQTILYLDHRHVDWFNRNPQILKLLLGVLKTRIMPKLRKEADGAGSISNMSKKEKVDVYSERDWQVAYFFRKMDDRHAVLLKEKSLVFPDDPALSEVKVEDELGNLHAPIPHAVASRQFSVSVKDEDTSNTVGDNDNVGEGETLVPPTPSQAARRVRRAESLEAVPDSDDDAAGLENVGTLFRGASVFDDNETQQGVNPGPRRSKRQRLGSSADSSIQVKDELEAVQAVDNEEDNDAVEVTLEDEEKMKPRLSVKYAGFRIFGKLLVLVVEPTKRYVAENPDIFGDKKEEEKRQLSVTPMPAGPLASNSRNGRATPIQTRFTSLEPSEHSSRNASLSRGATPLFRGGTPATEAGTPGPMPPPPVPPSVHSRRAATAASEREESTLPDDRQSDEADLEGFQLATQMLEREGLVMGGGNDIDEGD